MELKRRTGKFKEVDDYNKPGRDFREVFRNYRKYTTRTELFIFLGIPIVSSIIIFTYYWILEDSNSNLLDYIIEMNQISLTVIAILAGFNTTSLSIIAASNNKVLKYLKKQKVNGEGDNILNQLVSFFSFSILVQLIVLVFGIILFMVTKSFNDITQLLPFIKGMAAKIPLTALGLVWLSTILFTVMISIRNATLLYRYVLFIADYNGEE